MALVCAMSLNTQVYAAGASPQPQLTLTVGNPNATAVAVTAIQMQYFNAQTLAPLIGAVAPQTPAASPGQNVVVPAGSSLTFGPMPVAVGSASNMSTFYGPAVAGASNVNQQLGQPPQSQILIGATVYGSDGSANTATPIGLTVSYTPPPPALSQGGALNFSAASNAVTGLITGVL
jgi:hypothetical protein